MDVNAIVKDYISYTDAWQLSYVVWLYCGHIVGGLIIIGSIVVASEPRFITPRFIDVKTIAFLTAVLTGVNTFIDPLGRAKAYGTALAEVWPVLAEVEWASSTMKPGDAALNQAVKNLINTAAQATQNLHDTAVQKPPNIAVSGKG
jgi:hypothetical protein